MIYKEHNLHGRKIRVLITSLKIKANLPVIFLQDGQNLFDDDQATYGTSWGFKAEWEKKYPAIIVGIDSTKDRLNEYCPFKFDEQLLKLYDKDLAFVGGGGDEYLHFIVNVVKPFITKQYQASTNPQDIAIGGSSLGGYIALYALIKYPDHFAKGLCFSNAFWAQTPKLIEFINSHSLNHIVKLYLDVGNKESDNPQLNNLYLSTNRKVMNALNNQNIGERMLYQEIKDGIHHESAWRRRIKTAIAFIYQ